MRLQDKLQEMTMTYNRELPLDEQMATNVICGARNSGYTCTCEKGHKGDHVAHGHLTVVARWSR